MFSKKSSLTPNAKDKLVTCGLWNRPIGDENTIQIVTQDNAIGKSGRLARFWFLGKDFSKSKKTAVVQVPAVRYNSRKYAMKKNVECQPEHGSYAQDVNVTGGFNTMNYHRRYVKDAIIDSVLKAYHSGKYGLGQISTRSNCNTL